MVTSAAAVIQGVAKARNGAPLTPAALRELLVATGTPQPADDAAAHHIGPLPNVKAALDRMFPLPHVSPSAPPTPPPPPPEACMAGVAKDCLPRSCFGYRAAHAQLQCARFARKGKCRKQKHADKVRRKCPCTCGIRTRHTPSSTQGLEELWEKALQPQRL